MQYVSAVLGAGILLIVYGCVVVFLDRKLSLGLNKKKLFHRDDFIADKVFWAVGCLSFAAACYMEGRGVYDNFWMLLQNMAIILAMSIVAVTDLKVRLIPNRVLLGCLGAWSVVAVLSVIADTSAGVLLIGRSLLGGLVGGLIFLLCYLISRGQLGAGDVKLAFVMGLFLTGQRIVGAIAYGALICCVYSFIQMARKKLTMKDGVPLAPFLYLGTLLTFVIL